MLDPEASSLRSVNATRGMDVTGFSALMVFTCALFGVLALRDPSQIGLGLMSFGLAAVFMVLLGVLRRLPQP